MPCNAFRAALAAATCFAVLLLAGSSNLDACSRVDRPDPEPMVDRADVIVRALATGYHVPPPEDGQLWDDDFELVSRIRFEVLEVLKGDGVPGQVDLSGILTDRDDPNDHPPPYEFVRPAGRRGNCWAYEYKQGGEFLLLLDRHDGGLSVNWYALGAVNEQIEGPLDPWVMWVQGFLAADRFLRTDHEVVRE
jgi:hypothetical protein